MADPEGPIAKPEAFFGSILLAARVHASTAELWQAIRDYSASAGVGLPANMFSEVNRMRSLATGLRNAGEALAAAEPTDAITSAMIGTQLYARSAVEQSLAPAYHVRFEVETTGPDGTATSWYNLEYSGDLPATKAELYADIGNYAAELGQGYSLSVGALGTVEIGAF